jgi:hypothetical protein
VSPPRTRRSPEVGQLFEHLSSTDLADVSRLISGARSLFAAAEAAEEARDDAAAYLAV